ncbi:MAG: carbamoyltransferase [Candidatus Alcyoniella australis]|nr:carbamoyltransferase [Candidatus Alcyoniella australis]
MNILGISAFYHDSAAALLQDGRIVAAAQEERFSRLKHDPGYPANAIEYCLKTAGIGPHDLDAVAFYDKPFIKFERILKSYLAYAPRGLRSFMMAIPMWLKHKLMVPEMIRRELDDYQGPIYMPEHHESHAASAFFPSPYPEAAIITLDGVGEWTTTSIGSGSGNELRIDQEIRFPHSLGLLYSAFTYYCGFKVNFGEYKLMGLAPYGEPKYVDLILENLIDLRDDGSFKLDMRYFDYVAGLRMTSRRFHKLLGRPPRKGESKIDTFYMDVARSIQEVTETAMLHIARHTHQRTGLSKLCLAGGVALNCVGNGRLLREGPFDEVWIQPAAGDAGGALGAALFVWHVLQGQPRQVDGKSDLQHASYLGPGFEPDEIKGQLDERGAVYTLLDQGQIPGRVAELIADNKVVGWFQGRTEFGPRALGSRSIIGDARSRDMQTVMNLKIKFRESFRPFAPTVLADKVADWFDFDGESPYMLMVADVKADKLRELSDEDQAAQGLDKLRVIRSEVPAITHVNNSARLQTVSREDNPLYYEMIKAFDDLTGCPVIINTSFNVRGEPIVCSPDDAFVCFMRTDMDYLAVGPYLLDKTVQKPWKEQRDWRETYELD